MHCAEAARARGQSGTRNRGGELAAYEWDGREESGGVEREEDTERKKESS